tara:strand:- start:226 stop:492 length:267 start_codon:yes stop_codon:yes gene_type:complete
MEIKNTTQPRGSQMIARQIKLAPSKTYKTLANMEKAITKLMSLFPENTAVRYVLQRTDDNRVYPIFIASGTNEALAISFVHHGFCVCN